MTDKVWKQAERRVAILLGGRRRTGSGSDYKTGSDDLIHDHLFVEVKYRKHHPVVGWFKKAKELAAKDRKPPVLVLVEKRDSILYALVPLDADYLRNLAVALDTPH